MTDSPGIPHILVVDDEEDIALLFRHQFRRELRSGKLKLTVAHSADEALATLRSAAPSAFTHVFSDINMPGASGMELLAAIRREFGQLPVHMVSAYDDVVHIEEAASRGADGFISKPIDFAELRRVAEA